VGGFEECLRDESIGGSVRSVRREVRLVMVDVWGMPVRLMTR
jgi:hypothetical protein